MTDCVHLSPDCLFLRSASGFISMIWGIIRRLFTDRNNPLSSSNQVPSGNRPSRQPSFRRLFPHDGLFPFRRAIPPRLPVPLPTAFPPHPPLRCQPPSAPGDDVSLCVPCREAPAEKRLPYGGEVPDQGEDPRETSTLRNLLLVELPSSAKFSPPCGIPPPRARGTSTNLIG